MGSLSPSNLAIILIPGGASPAALYRTFVDRLQALTGLEVYVYDNPSTIPSPSQEPAGIAEDAAFVGTKIKELADRGKDVVLLPHSYAGLISSEAAKGFEKADRALEGLPGGVVHIIYLSCIVAGVGESSGEVCAQLKFDWLVPLEADDRYVHSTDAGAKRVFNDMEPSQALALTQKMAPQAIRSFSDKITYDCYKRVPMTYILCEQDDVLPPQWQEERIAWLKSQRSDDGPAVVRLNAGHFPPASDVEGTANAVIESLVKAGLHTQ